MTIGRSCMGSLLSKVRSFCSKIFKPWLPDHQPNRPDRYSQPPSSNARPSTSIGPGNARPCGAQRSPAWLSSAWPRCCSCRMEEPPSGCVTVSHKLTQREPSVIAGHTMPFWKSFGCFGLRTVPKGCRSSIHFIFRILQTQPLLLVILPQGPSFR